MPAKLIGLIVFPLGTLILSTMFSNCLFPGTFERSLPGTGRLTKPEKSLVGIGRLAKPEKSLIGTGRLFRLEDPLLGTGRLLRD